MTLLSGFVIGIVWCVCGFYPFIFICHRLHKLDEGEPILIDNVSHIKIILFGPIIFVVCCIAWIVMKSKERKELAERTAKRMLRNNHGQEY